MAIHDAVANQDTAGNGGGAKQPAGVSKARRVRRVGEVAPGRGVLYGLL